ncbi:hypothetical protein PAEPH01_2216, partial [Pancytospora epiphaga]
MLSISILCWGSSGGGRLLLNPKKCHVGKAALKMLGYLVSEGSVKPDPDKIEAIRKINKSTTLKKLRSFLGLFNYSRNFIPHCADLTALLTNLLKRNSKGSSKQIEWSQTFNKAFKNLKSMLLSNLERVQPDLSKPFVLITDDASDVAIEAMLAQEDKCGHEQMIYTFSKTLDKAEKNYCITNRELLAIVKAVQHFRHYLLGKEFVLCTDHKALAYLRSAQNPNSRMLIWALIPQEFSFKVEYINGDSNAADFLSRPTTKINTASKIQPTDHELTLEQKQEILKEYHERL